MIPLPEGEAERMPELRTWLQVSKKLGTESSARGCCRQEKLCARCLPGKTGECSADSPPCSPRVGRTEVTLPPGGQGGKPPVNSHRQKAHVRSAPSLTWSASGRTHAK